MRFSPAIDPRHPPCRGTLKKRRRHNVLYFSEHRLGQPTPPVISPDLWLLLTIRITPPSRRPVSREEWVQHASDTTTNPEHSSVPRCVLSNVFLDVLRFGDLLVLVVPALFQLPARVLDARPAEFRRIDCEAGEQPFQVAALTARAHRRGRRRGQLEEFKPTSAGFARVLEDGHRDRP